MPQSIHAFAEKVALVINGSEGIGRAVALQLALQGCYVIISYEKTSDAQANAVESLTSLGTLAHAVESSDIKDICTFVNQTFGRLDLLVNCVKFGDDSQFQINTITNEALELMKHRPKPSIVNVISENQNVKFVDNLPSNFRQNCIVTKEKKEVIEHELFSVNNYDDIARVSLFLLSSEAKVLNQQVLYVH